MPVVLATDFSFELRYNGGPRGYDVINVPFVRAH